MILEESGDLVRTLASNIPHCPYKVQNLDRTHEPCIPRITGMEGNLLAEVCLVEERSPLIRPVWNLEEACSANLRDLVVTRGAAKRQHAPPEVECADMCL